MDVVKAFKEHRVLYVSQFEWGAFIWRPLTWDEASLYTQLFRMAPQAKAELEEEIFELCVIEHPLPPEDFWNWQAGIVTTVANQIIYFSRPVGPEDFLERLDAVRDVARQNAFNAMYAHIMRAFPSYKIEDLQVLPLEVLLERLAIAEIVLQEPLPLHIKDQPKKPGVVDFETENRRMFEVDANPPAGDWNLHRRRSQGLQ